MNYDNSPIIITKEPSLAVNKVIRDTYILLSLTLLFSAFTASMSMSMGASPAAHLFSIVGALLLILVVLPFTAKSAYGIAVVFAITGLMGFSLGPMLDAYMSLPKGPEIVATAMGGTGVVFLGLSAYALTTRKDFSFMGGFLFVGLLVVLLAMLVNIFLALPLLTITISAVVVLMMSAYILYDTSAIIHGGETNYILATVNLYLDIFNLFIHLLRILGFLSRDD